ncbi:MAG: DUF3108 domain-containing protein [Bacteroidales bacterium]|nr:DUF3108 domain-containing protein [Bacteroidales bacterium]
MLKTIFTSLILIFFLTFNLKAGIDSTYLDSIPDNAFQVGEKLIYEVRYGMIRGGEAACEVGIIPYGYSYAYHFQTIIETAGIAEKIAIVKDIYESFVEIESILPIKAVRNIRENNYTSYNEVVFNRKEKSIFSSKDGDVENVPDSVMDIISAFYYTRSYMYEFDNTEKPIELYIYLDKEIYLLKIHYIETEKTRTEFGNIQTKLFAPVVEKGDFFAEKQELEIWFSDDKNFIPVKISAKTPVGKLKILLKEHSGLKYDLKTYKEIKKEKEEKDEKEFFMKKIFNIFKKD